MPLIISWILFLGLCVAFVEYIKVYYEERAVLAPVAEQIKTGFESETATLSSEELEENEKEELEEEENPLEEVKESKINTLIQNVLDAMVKGDAATLRTLDRCTDTYKEEDSLKQGAELIKGFQNIKNYSKKGLLADTYFIFTVVDMKVKDCDTLAPSMFQFYVVKGEEGFQIDTTPADDMEIAVSNYMVKMQNEEDVLQLVSKVNQDFATACQNDKNLKKIVTGQS